MKKIGITGGIGAGKSIVSKIIKLLGYSVFDSDTEAKKILNFDPQVKERVIQIFGIEYNSQGADRQTLAKIVFENPQKLKILNSIIHPKVIEQFENWAKQQQQDLVFMENAILFENGFDKYVDSTILVYAPIELRRQRVLFRNRNDKFFVDKIMRNQAVQEDLIDKADFLIINDNEHLLVPQVIEVIEILRGVK